MWVRWCLYPLHWTSSELLSFQHYLNPWVHVKVNASSEVMGMSATIFKIETQLTGNTNEITVWLFLKWTHLNSGLSNMDDWFHRHVCMVLNSHKQFFFQKSMSHLLSIDWACSLLTHEMHIDQRPNHQTMVY